MKIKLDRTMCDGFGKCAEHAPSVFSLDEWGYASLAGQADVPDDLGPRVRRAIPGLPGRRHSRASRASGRPGLTSRLPTLRLTRDGMSRVSRRIRAGRHFRSRPVMCFLSATSW